MANAALDQETPLAIDLYDEAKNTVLELARRNGVSEGDVVARALGILWILDDEKRKGGRVLIEDEHGKLRPISINLREGDAGASTNQGR
jgi:hypothetical protein